MRKIVVASTRRASGKTSIIVGTASNIDLNVGYIKPFGDRLLYRKKRLWDYDSALMTELFRLDEKPEDISIGLDHSKLRYMFDEASVADRLREMVERVGAGKDILFVEGCHGLSYGSSVHLDPINVARTIDADLVLVTSGPADAMVDDLQFIMRNVDLSGINLRGVVLNKVVDPREFDSVHMDMVTDTGIPIIGVIPTIKDLERFSVRFLADALFAKVLAAESAMGRQVEQVFVGAMSGQEAMRNPQFDQTAKLIITSGDRTDMISAALDGDTAAIILTNNVPTTPRLVAKAEDRGIPLLLVAHDTYQIAKMVDRLEPLMTPDNEERMDLLGDLVRRNLDMEQLIG